MKRLMAALLAMAMILSYSTIAFAKNDKSAEFVEKANIAVSEFSVSESAVIAEAPAPSDEDYAKIDARVAKANAKINTLVEAAMESEDPDLDSLVAKTNAIAYKVIDKAAKLGIEVKCEYTAYEIDGQTIYIDPLRVVRR